MTPHSLPKVLFIDAYDSFTNNIVALLEVELHVRVIVIRIQTYLDDFEHFLKSFSAIILGPGPGDPRRTDDVGLFNKVWQLHDDHIIPVLGICLGFQSLVLAFGGHVQRLAGPRHGIVRKVRHIGEDIFQGGLSPLIESVQYHSLHATFSNDEDLQRYSIESRKEDYSPSVSLLRALAWDDRSENHSADQPAFKGNPSSILMAVRHVKKPFHGLQFHPESICSSPEARIIILNWWDQVGKWWRARLQSPKRLGALNGLQRTNVKRRNSEVNCLSCNGVPCGIHGRPAVGDRQNRYGSSPRLANGSHLSYLNGREGQTRTHRGKRSAKTRIMPLANLTVPGICSRLELSGKGVVVLDSESHQRSEVGNHSIIGIVKPESLRFDYTVNSGHIYQRSEGHSIEIDLLDRHGGCAFEFLKSFVKEHEATSSHINIPFWGGLVGYISYEACLETIDVGPRFDLAHGPSEPSRPDMSFVFVERSIVISHFEKKVYVQSIIPDDDQWLEKTAQTLRIGPFTPPPTALIPSLNARIILPSKYKYKYAIRASQAYIRAGDSYELCLTNKTIITTPGSTDSWSLYQRLRHLNPAPFAAYLRLGALTLLSSSPERFLSWSRPRRHQRNGGASIACQFRPIKGTLQRQPDPSLPPLTYQQAKELLATPKETAENLMIVDLIRHDLHGVVGSGNVNVPKLMVVEEYKTLFQLVSVIEGTLHVPGTLQHRDHASAHPEYATTARSQGVKSPISASCPSSGIDVLAASLPPGSMTGAPKLRSCQLLQSLERKPRGVYSGVVGYLDIGGGGDFSVVIRSAVRWDDRSGSRFNMGHSTQANGMHTREQDAERPEDCRETWTIGAGGAITALSSEDGEYDEMMGKLKSTLRLFEDETTTYETQADDM